MNAHQVCLTFKKATEPDGNTVHYLMMRRSRKRAEKNENGIPEIKTNDENEPVGCEGNETHLVKLKMSSEFLFTSQRSHFQNNEWKFKKRKTGNSMNLSNASFIRGRKKNLNNYERIMLLTFNTNKK